MPCDANQVTPLLKDRAKLMEILDPSLQDSVNEKHLHQVTALTLLAAPQSNRAPIDTITLSCAGGRNSSTLRAS